METFYRIWSPTRGYWDGGYLSEPSSWGCRPSVARIPFDEITARRWLKSMRGGANPPCPDARLVRVTVRRVSREARPDDGESSETLKTLAAGLRAFAERELATPQEPRVAAPGGTAYAFKLEDPS